jgi:hypothetical protein
MEERAQAAEFDHVVDAQYLYLCSRYQEALLHLPVRGAQVQLTYQLSCYFNGEFR